MCLGLGMPIIIEAIIPFTGFFLFIFAAVLSMFHVEQDYHLMFMTDTEEWLHTFFAKSRLQVNILIYINIFKIFLNIYF